MRRLAATVALVCLSQSVMLSTGILCESVQANSPGMPQMAGMPDSGGEAEGAQAPMSSSPDRNHSGAHCPLMAGCVAVAMRIPPLEIPVLGRPTIASRIACVVAPQSERIAPEPPPPKG